MSKRPNEESREDRWLRKMKMYEEKIKAKRQRRAEKEQRVLEQQRNEPPVAQGVQNEEHIVFNERVSETEQATPVADNVVNNDNMIQDDVAYAEYDLHDGLAIDEESIMTETTACTSPNSSHDDDVGIVSTDDFDPQLLRELGESETEPAEFGDNLQTDVASKLQKILQNGIKKEIKQELLKKYPFPQNVPLAKSPTLNPEIGAMLSIPCKQRDSRILAKQNQLGKTISALGKALTGLLKKTPDIPDVIRTLNDASMLLADSHFMETSTRRSVIIPLIDNSLTDPFKDRKRDSFLFGEKLGDLVKDSKSLKKTGQLIQPSNSILNARGPSSRGAQRGYQRSGQSYPQRAGGPRAAIMAPPPYPYPYQYPIQRRAAVQQRPQAPRRHPAPPPLRARRPPPPPVHRPSNSRQGQA